MMNKRNFVFLSENPKSCDAAHLSWSVQHGDINELDLHVSQFTISTIEAAVAAACSFKKQNSK